MLGLKAKAVDHLLWLNFIHRNTEDYYKIIKTQHGNLKVIHHSLVQSDQNLSKTRAFTKSYRRMKYAHIAEISKDSEPLAHWEAIRGMVATQDGELLRFIIKHKIPLEKFIRYELASRGFDEDHQWCGFEKAAKIWLK